MAVAGDKSLICSECYSSLKCVSETFFLVHASMKGDLQKEGAIPHVGGSGDNSGSGLLEFPCKERWMYGTTVRRNQQWPQTEQKLGFVRIQSAGVV